MGGKNPLDRARRRRSADRGVGRGQRRVLSGRAALHRVEPADRHRGHSRSIRRGDDRAHEDARHRRRAEAGHRDRPGRRRPAAREEPRVPRASAATKARGSRTAANGCRRDTDGYYMAPALFTDTHARHAHQPRGDLRSGRGGDSRAGLRRGAADGQRHAVRPVGRHRHDVAEVREPLQAAIRRAAW